MNCLKSSYSFCIKPITTLWLFMYIVLFTAFLFPGKGSFGFYSVEWSFFFFAALFIYISILSVFLYEKFAFKWDEIYGLLIIFLGITCLSIIDAANRIRGMLFIGQYIPYFFFFFLIVNIVSSRERLNKVINMLTHLAFIFIFIAVMLALFFRDRTVLNDFLLNNFNIAVNKIFTYIELPFCVVTYNLVNNRFKAYNLIFFLFSLLVVILSGSRGSLLILLGALGLILLKGKKNKKIMPVALLSMVIILGGLFVSPYTADRLSKLFVTSKQDYEENIAAFSRLYTAQVALRLMEEHPINGVGIGNSSYYAEKIINNLSLPHEIVDFWESRKLFETTSTPLKLGSELGITGVIFFFIFYYYLWRRIKLKDGYDSNDSKFLFSALEIYVIVAFVHNFIDLGFTNYYSWFYYGIVIAAARVVKTEVKF